MSMLEKLWGSIPVEVDILHRLDVYTLDMFDTDLRFRYIIVRLDTIWSKFSTREGKEKE